MMKWPIRTDPGFGDIEFSTRNVVSCEPYGAAEAPSCWTHRNHVQKRYTYRSSALGEQDHAQTTDPRPRLSSGGDFFHRIRAARVYDAQRKRTRRSGYFLSAGRGAGARRGGTSDGLSRRLELVRRCLRGQPRMVVCALPEL